MTQRVGARDAGTKRRSAAEPLDRRRPGSETKPSAVQMAAKQDNVYDYYGGWFGKIAERLDDEFRQIRSIKNIELGEEFEIALCRALRRLLPERVGVCRGWIVDAPGNVAGDDIIVYDAARFPTLRMLGRAAEAKEQVPAEAVLAYIEAKHTLYARANVPKKHCGQAIAKACAQVASVKSLCREPVSLETFAPRFQAPRGTFKQRLGFPAIRNPWYAAVWALNLVVDKPLRQTPASALSLCVERLERDGALWPMLPDVIAAGSVIMMPIVQDGLVGHFLARPTIAEDTRLSFTQGAAALGAAVLHLTWAIEDIMLGEIPWVNMMQNHLAHAEEQNGESVVLAASKKSALSADTK